MRTLVDKPTAPIAKHGISLDDPIEKFWDVFCSTMSADKKAAAAQVAKILREEYGAITPGAMFASVYWHEMETITQDSHGSLGWLRTIEYFFSQEFRRMATNAPPSAALVTLSMPLKESASALSKLNRQRSRDETERQPAKRVKYSTWLKENNMFEAALSLQKADIDAMVVETQKPVRTRLKYNDTKRISEYAFLKLCNEAELGCDKVIFEFWEEQLTSFGYPLPTHDGTWPTTFKWRFKNGRKAAAPVRHIPRTILADSAAQCLTVPTTDLAQAIYPTLKMNEADATDGVKALKESGLHLPLSPSAPRLIGLQQQPSDGANEDDDEDLFGERVFDKPPEAARPAELPRADSSTRNRTQEEKAAELAACVNEVDAELATLSAPDLPFAGMYHAPPTIAPLGAAAADKAKPKAQPKAQPKAKRKAKRKANDDSDHGDSDDGGSDDDDDDSDSESEYEFEKIVGHRGAGRTRRYEIKWVGYEETTFEPARNICKSNVKEYEASLPAEHVRSCTL